MVIFLTILITDRNASAPGLNDAPYKVYKKCPKQVNFFSKLFKLVSKGGKSLSNGGVLKRSIFLKLALNLITL